MRKQELHPHTEIINKKQKHQAKKARMEALTWLATVFPAAFDNRVRIQPLKLGIMTDILKHADKAMAEGISKSKLREAVVVFTRRIDYLTCLKAREMRVDLEGNAVVAVSEEEANHAAQKIKKRVEKSMKNARKDLVNKFSSQNTYRTKEPLAYQAEHDLQLESGHPESTTARTTAVLIKHKPSRAYDPDAVARLKEKLGLSLKSNVKEETT